MVDSFNHKGLRRLFEQGDRKLLRADLVERIATLLGYLDAAKVIEDLDIPSLRLHPLKANSRAIGRSQSAPTGASSFDLPTGKPRQSN